MIDEEAVSPMSNESQDVAKQEHEPLVLSGSADSNDDNLQTECRAVKSKVFARGEIMVHVNDIQPSDTSLSLLHLIENQGVARKSDVEKQQVLTKKCK